MIMSLFLSLNSCFNLRKYKCEDLLYSVNGNKLVPGADLGKESLSLEVLEITDQYIKGKVFEKSCKLPVNDTIGVWLTTAQDYEDMRLVKFLMHVDEKGYFKLSNQASNMKGKNRVRIVFMHKYYYPLLCEFKL